MKEVDDEAFDVGPVVVLVAHEHDMAVTKTCINDAVLVTL